jgi:pyruvate ferredoxin oxidoreductase beta subunit
MFEVEDGKYKLSRKPKEKLPIEEWLKGQGRFSHIFKPENAGMIESFQANVDKKWARVLDRCGESE